jgi:hypothetical protein
MDRLRLQHIRRPGLKNPITYNYTSIYVQDVAHNSIDARWYGPARQVVVASWKPGSARPHVGGSAQSLCIALKVTLQCEQQLTSRFYLKISQWDADNDGRCLYYRFGIDGPKEGDAKKTEHYGAIYYTPSGRVTLEEREFHPRGENFFCGFTQQVYRQALAVEEWIEDEQDKKFPKQITKVMRKLCFPSWKRKIVRMWNLLA